MQMQKKSKAFALLIKYAFDPFPCYWRLRSSRLDPSSQDFDRVNQRLIPLLGLLMKKIADCTAFVTKNLSQCHISFVIFPRRMCSLINVLKLNINLAVYSFLRSTFMFR
jgi:hypothetical protein